VPCAGACDFTGAVQVGPDDVSIAVAVPLPTAGTYHFACMVGGHCEYGAMSVQVDVGTCGGDALQLPAAPPRVSARTAQCCISASAPATAECYGCSMCRRASA